MNKTELESDSFLVTRTLPIFRAGTHTDSAGDTKTWTVEELDKMVAVYNNQSEEDRHEAPAVLGHPRDDSPAYGWVESLHRVGDVLFAKFCDMKDEFMQWIQDKHYKYRSASIYSNYLLKHVGFLGGTPPAVKGLGAIKLAEHGKASTYSFGETASTGGSEFGDYRINTVARLMLRIRDWFVEKEGAEAAEKIINAWEVQELLREPQESVATPYSEITDSSLIDKGASMTEAEIQALQEENKRLAAEQAVKDTELQQMRLQHAKNMAAARVDRFKGFCESDKNKGRVVPAIKARLYALYEHAIASDTDPAKPVEISFSESDGTNVVAKSLKIDELFQQFVESLPVLASGERVVTAEKADESANYSESAKAADLITARFAQK